MTNSEMEKKLLDNGFTERDIQQMKTIIERGKDEKETLFILVSDLRKRFFAACYCIGMLLMVCFFSYFFSEKITRIDVISYGFVMIFTIIIICYMTPINLGLKSFLFKRKES